MGFCHVFKVAAIRFTSDCLDYFANGLNSVSQKLVLLSSNLTGFSFEVKSNFMFWLKQT